MKKQKKPKNYKLRSKVYKGVGMGTIGVTTIGGFLTYQLTTDWASFNDLANSVVTEGTKLNMAIAIPLLVSIVVFLLVFRKKNQEFFKNNISVTLLIGIMVLYLMYSVIEMTMVSLAGAFVGTLADETIFSTLSKSAKIKSAEKQEIDIEYDKEVRRIEARKKAEVDLGGSV